MTQLTRLRARLAALAEKAAAPSKGHANHAPRVYAALPEHTARYAGCLMPSDLTPYERRVFSQNGEDGVIAEILLRIGVTVRWFVEFGIGTGHQGNCVLLADVYGWNGLFCEPDAPSFRKLSFKYQTNPRVITDNIAITPGNVERVFEQHGVPEEFDVLSIDVDTIDYWIWDSVRRFRPRVVVVEYNGSLSMERALVYPQGDSARWDETAYYGSSLGAFRQLAAEKGYTLVHTDLSGVNAFFVREDLAGLVDVTEPPMRTVNFWLSGGEMPVDPLNRSWSAIDRSDPEDDAHP